VLLCLALQNRFAHVEQRDRSQRSVDAQTLRACWRYLRHGLDPNDTPDRALVTNLNSVCSDHPQLAALVPALPEGEIGAWMGPALDLFRVLVQHEGLPRCMSAALAEHLMQELLAVIAQDLWRRLLDACNEIRGAPGEVPADIDDILVRVFGGRRARAGDRSGLSEQADQAAWERVVDLLLQANASGGSHATRSTTPASHRPRGSARTPASTVSATPPLNRAEQMAARARDLLPRAATGICSGLGSAERDVSELLALEIGQRLTQSGARLFSSKLRSILTFHRIQGAKVLGTHLGLLRDLFVAPPQWVLYRLACRLPADLEFEGGKVAPARPQSAPLVWDFLLRWPAGLERSAAYLVEHGCDPVRAEQASRRLGARRVTELNLSELTTLTFALGRPQHIEPVGQVE
jgi:hypothetical protein